MMTTIIEDSRQKIGQHNTKNAYFFEHGISVVRSKLPYGDYALCPQIAVDTKKDIYELAMDIDQQHQRFKKECINARDNGCKLYVLVENDFKIASLCDLSKWVEPDSHFNMRKSKSGNPRTRTIQGERLARACSTMSTRYGVQFLFCSPEQSGEIIIKLLKGDSTNE